jgi:hypothetical protein
MATIYTANSSSITIDSNTAPVEGVQSIDYRVVRQQNDVFALGSAERVTAYYGATRVQGRIHIASANPVLDGLASSGAMFQVVCHLPNGPTLHSIAFDDCFITNKEFSLQSGGHGETIYTFSATRIREEDAPAPAAA